MPEQVTITGLERIRDPQPTLKGHMILAFFTADIGVFTIKGCALARTAEGKLGAWLPNLNDTKARSNRYIVLNDQPTQDSLLQRALQMYRRMGGTEADRRARESDEREAQRPEPRSLPKTVPEGFELPVPFVRKPAAEDARLERAECIDLNRANLHDLRPAEIPEGEEAAGVARFLGVSG